METDALQLTLRFSFRARLMPSVMLAMLLVCMTATMIIECQVHTTGSAHEHAMPSRPHHSHDASGYTADVMPCMMAVLSFVALLIIFNVSSG